MNVDTGRAAPGWGDDELLDDLAAHVLRRGGEVLVLDGEELGASGQSLYAELR